MADIKASILIVEDEESVRTSLLQVFEALGYRARSAEDGLAALVEIRREVPDILLSDLNMPAMSGFELLSIVRRRFPAMHVIAMSGAGIGDHQVPCGVAADGFYQKGNGVAALLTAMNARAPSKRDAATQEPIWIQRNGHDTSGGEFVTIACPECFRTFPQPISDEGGLILDTNCVFCQSWISYAIVESNGLMFPQRFQPAPRFANPRCRY